MSALAIDPYREAAPAPEWRYLHHLNPLAKLFGPLPIMLLLLFSRGVAIPAAFVALTLVLLLTGARLSGRMLALLLVGLPIAIAVLGVSFGIWVDPSRLPADALGAGIPLVTIGGWTFELSAYLTGLATAMRLASLLLLSLIAGLTSTGPDLARAMVQNLKVPYRVGYTALAAYRFVPRFGHELEVIRAAHRVRGTERGRGPIAATKRILGYAVPLLASAIRHAERVALAMDARAFGAHPTRTERHLVPWRVRDWVFVVGFWAVSVLLYWWVIQAGLGSLSDSRTGGG
ncbi:energy-coupling factor transporter transmembrane component T family protein [Agromyces seonyuensis]|uniref:Energy-coupling factor transporter transmembrane protein EcfT n=1 Tax=Agromyces seonyuensis TaxID=2662446 RepID=A0A6I4NWR2_9MICO|nr:energy-coupling factor transporter transmembrane component T [Agromyces seonyuensis]MWB98621.1 energy-coupling factor transporter transmembrane protein EcfT [Agromyces seonyuensis]